jgi:hypothetical protein
MTPTFKRSETTIPGVTLPETTQVSYECTVEGCDFTCSTEREYEWHFAREHAAVYKVVSGDAFLLFECEENFDAFQSIAPEYHEDPRGHRLGWGYWGESAWRGRGWYRVHNFSRPCPRGCCTDSVSELVFVSNWIEELRGEITELEETIEAVTRELEIEET